MKKATMAALSGAVIFLVGCSKPQKSDVPALQGTWMGVIQDNPPQTCSMVISGTNFEFRGISETNVWYKGTFSLRENATPPQYIARITECAFPQYAGKTSMAIYRLDSDSLTLAGNEPGNPAAPTAFDATNAARMELKRK